MRQYLENIKTLNGFDALGDINYVSGIFFSYKKKPMKCSCITQGLEKFQQDGEKLVTI